MRTDKYTHDRQEWVNRFFGYMGVYHYLKKNGKILTISEKLDVLKEKISSTEASTYSKAHNIVYIYGGPRCGKREYITLLENALEKNEDCCVRLELSGENQESASMLRTKLKRAFEEQLKFKFPCMNVAEYGDDAKERLKKEVMSVVAGVNSYATGDKLGGSFTILKELYDNYQRWESTRLLDNDIKEIFREIVEELKSYKQRNENFAVDVENQYLWMELDLMANCRRCSESTVVCVIENFHFWDKYLTDPTERKKFSRFLNEMSDVIWVLVSEKKPVTPVLDFLCEENVWRMSGLNATKTDDFLREVCPSRQREWYDEAYKRTYGYVGLVDLCVEKEVIGQEWCATEGVNEDNDEKKLLESWFNYVWCGCKKDRLEENLRKGVLVSETIEFLMEKEIDSVRDENSSEKERLIIPCICYLVERTLENPETIGTVRQFSWDKGVNWGLTRSGNQCMTYIQNNSPFCIEYTDFPNTLYLDPIIVEVISNHHKYEEWLKIFEDECMENDREKKSYEESKKHLIDEVRAIEIRRSMAENLNDDYLNKIITMKVHEELEKMKSQLVKDDKKNDGILEPVTSEGKKAVYNNVELESCVEERMDTEEDLKESDMVNGIISESNINNKGEMIEEK